MFKSNLCYSLHVKCILCVCYMIPAYTVIKIRNRILYNCNNITSAWYACTEPREIELHHTAKLIVEPVRGFRNGYSAAEPVLPIVNQPPANVLSSPHYHLL